MKKKSKTLEVYYKNGTPALTRVRENEYFIPLDFVPYNPMTLEEVSELGKMLKKNKIKLTIEVEEKETPYTRLKDYIETDDVLIDKSEDSDFAKFCDEHCNDIESVLDCIDEIDNYIDELDENDFEKYRDYNLVYCHLQEIKDLIKKVVD